MPSENLQEALGSQATIAPRAIAVIDDALIALRLAHVPEDEREPVKVALAANLNVPPTGLSSPAEFDAALDALTDPSRYADDAVAAVINVSSSMERLIYGRRAVRELAALLEAQIGAPVVRCDPTDLDWADLEKCDLIFIDYYLEGDRVGQERAKAIAKAIRERLGASTLPQIVLMSSYENVRNHRSEFRSDAGLSGVAFAFVAKTDIDERWKLKAYLSMLERAKPHAPALSSYRAKLETSLEDATKAVLNLADDLDIGDYAYVQAQALHDDGHPLGDYFSWLLSSHLTAAAFESEGMRASQRILDALEFENEPFDAPEPSPNVAKLYHSALVSSNLGPLGKHPRAKEESKFAAYPFIGLGDVFFDGGRSRAMVVLSADCDLAFSTTDERAPRAETPVILVPGEPTALKKVQAGEVKSRTEGIVLGDQIYRIDWHFNAYRSVELQHLKDWLQSKGFELRNRDRLRSLYALKLQQEFGAYLLRVGPPVMPPVTFSAHGGTVYVFDGREKHEYETADTGEIMLSMRKGETVLRMTLKLVGRLRKATQDLLERLKDSKVADAATTSAEASKKQAKANEDIQRKIDALSRTLDNDDHWIDLLHEVVLRDEGIVADQGGVCSFVQGKLWKHPSKPRVILEIQAERPLPGNGKTGDLSED